MNVLLNDELDSLPSEADVARALRLFRAGKVDLATLCGLTSDEVEAAYCQARGLLERGLHEQAIVALEGLIIIRPARSRYHRALGFAYQRARRSAKAYAAFDLAVRLDPTDLIAEIMRAECALEAIGVDAGRSALQQALERATDDPAHAPYVERARRLLMLTAGHDMAESPMTNIRNTGATNVY